MHWQAEWVQSIDKHAVWKNLQGQVYPFHVSQMQLSDKIISIWKTPGPVTSVIRVDPMAHATNKQISMYAQKDLFL